MDSVDMPSSPFHNRNSLLYKSFSWAKPSVSPCSELKSAMKYPRSTHNISCMYYSSSIMQSMQNLAPTRQGPVCDAPVLLFPQGLAHCGALQRSLTVGQLAKEVLHFPPMPSDQCHTKYVSRRAVKILLLHFQCLFAFAPTTLSYHLYQFVISCLDDAHGKAQYVVLLSSSSLRVSLTAVPRRILSLLVS